MRLARDFTLAHDICFHDVTSTIKGDFSTQRVIFLHLRTPPLATVKMASLASVTTQAGIDTAPTPTPTPTIITAPTITPAAADAGDDSDAYTPMPVITLHAEDKAVEFSAVDGSTNFKFVIEINKLTPTDDPVPRRSTRNRLRSHPYASKELATEVGVVGIFTVDGVPTPFRADDFGEEGDAVITGDYDIATETLVVEFTVGGRWLSRFAQANVTFFKVYAVRDGAPRTPSWRNARAEVALGAGPTYTPIASAMTKNLLPNGKVVAYFYR